MEILHVGWGFWPLRYGGLMNYVEDLMDAQVAGGDRVSYFFAGRHYPLIPKDRLHRWSRRGIRMREILNSSLSFAGATLTPRADLEHAPSERHFRAVLREVSPDVVHIQELLGLPSSIIDIANAAGIPVLATLQDYAPLCPTTKLYDVDGQLCLRHDVGEQCARCCAAVAAPSDYFKRWTLAYELRQRLPRHTGERAANALSSSCRRLRRLRAARPASAASAATQEFEAPRRQPRSSGTSAQAYQDRRDTNLERLSRADLLIAQSHRVKEIYAHLGVPSDRLRVMQLTLSHLDMLTPRSMTRPPRPVHFATLNGCVAPSKGSEVILAALEQLHQANLDDQFKLTVLGSATPETQRRLAALPAAQYAGEYDISSLDSALATVDVGIIPSAWEEAYGYVGVEFLAKGIPLIGNRRGGIVDYTRDGATGWVNDDATGAGLAKIMAGLIAEPVKIVEIHRSVIASRATLILPMQQHARAMDEVYRELTARSPRRTSLHGGWNPAAVKSDTSAS